MSSELEAQAAKLLRRDFPVFCKTFLRIKTKQGSIKPLELNKAQMYLWRKIRQREKDGEPVRIVILKARQMGISTMIQAYMFWKALTCPGHNGLVVAHLEDPASELFSKIELMYRLLPDELHAPLERIRDTAKKGKKLAWAGELNTLLYVDTANNAALGRSQTFQHVHLSELGFYDRAEEIMFGLGQSVPRTVNTSIFVESTANGMGNYFHSMWDRAVSGESSYEPVFLPWHWDSNNVIEIPKDFSLVDEEAKLKSRLKLSDQQIFWRRNVIDDECDGDIEKFNQEHPGEPNDAFLISGRPYFNVDNLIKIRKQLKEPLREGYFEVAGKRPEFIDAKDGVWRVFVKPKPHSSYVIGADVAGGSARDFSAAHVLDATTMEQVASYRGKLDPDEFARELKWMGLAYNTALVAVEKNGEGRATVLKLHKDLAYPRIFFHMSEDDWKGGVQQRWGWTTSARTRPTMLAQLAASIRSSGVKVNDSRTLTELESFVRVDSSKIAEAARGAFDDMVMSLAIACSSEVRSQSVNHGEIEYEYDYEPDDDF